MSSIQQKITRNIKKSRKYNPGWKKAKSIVTDPEITQMTESVDEDMEKVMTTFHMFGRNTLITTTTHTQFPLGMS